MSLLFTVMSNLYEDASQPLSEYRQLVVEPLDIKMQVCTYRRTVPSGRALLEQLEPPVIVLDTSGPVMLDGAARYVRYMEAHPSPQRGIVIVAPWYQRGLVNTIESLPARHPLRHSESMQWLSRWLDRRSRRDTVFIDAKLDDAVSTGMLATHHFVRADNEVIKQILNSRQVINYTKQ